MATRYTSRSTPGVLHDGDPNDRICDLLTVRATCLTMAMTRTNDTKILIKTLINHGLLTFG